MNDFLIYGIVALVAGYLIDGLTRLHALGGVLITLGWVGVIVGLVLTLFGYLRGTRR